MYEKKKKRNGQKRHTHATAAGLEDALAVAVDIIRECRQAILFIESRTQKLVEILQTMRKGPHEYDPEKPAGLKITIKRRQN